MPISCLIDEAFAHHQNGRFYEAESLYRAALEMDADNFQALQLLGTLALRSRRIDEALVWLKRAHTILKRRGDESKRHASLYNNLGIVLKASGRYDEAILHFRQGLELDPSLTELHISLGRAFMEQGNHTAAADCFGTALNLAPNLPGCLCDLGTVYARSGRLEDAIGIYRRVLSIETSHWAARLNLAQMLRRTEKYDDAVALLTGLLEESPDNPLIHSQLGSVYAVSRRFDLALKHFRCVLAQKPDDAEGLQYIANIQQVMGLTKEADTNFRRSLELRPLITISATRSPPAFRALLLFAPGAGNTPLDFLVDRAEYENNILNLLPNAPYDIEALRNRVDVVVNLVADVDQGRNVLPLAMELVDRIGKPTVNHPQKILQTGRESIASLLATAPGCLVPKTCRYDRSALLDSGFTRRSMPFPFPFLMRPAGTHGGVDFEKIHDEKELHAFVTSNSSTDFYLTEYTDYRSPDGFFRKYRFIFVNNEILPYHLAIDNKWKVHHVTTDMANQPWMQEEEKSFLENPCATFGSKQYDALRAIQERSDLEYSGIDCALDREGRVVIFEVNACMLVHQHNEKFSYKAEAVRCIKTAFDTMLRRMSTNAERDPC